MVNNDGTAVSFRIIVAVNCVFAAYTGNVYHVIIDIFAVKSAFVQLIPVKVIEGDGIRRRSRGSLRVLRS